MENRVGPGVAKNQYDHSRAAESALEEEISKDMEILGQTEEDFRFFLAFAHEIMDQYGRLLCFINRYQLDENIPESRPISYNERLLHQAMVSPYFIWPNISPFYKKNKIDAVIMPGTAKDAASEDEVLRRARQWAHYARERKIGIFNTQDPLKLLPFEVRYLARRAPPARWVIDLSRNDDVLIHPQSYFTIPNVEDRLFIPEEYVPLFVEEGWKAT